MNPNLENYHMVIVDSRISAQSSVTRLAEEVSDKGLGFREVESEKSLQMFEKSRARSAATGEARWKCPPRPS